MVDEPVIVFTGPIEAPGDEHAQVAASSVVIPNPEMIIRSSASWRNRVVALVATGSFPIDAELIGSMTSLKVIASYGVGTDHIDIEAASRLGVMVTNLKNVLEGTVAELAMALMLAVVRRIVELDRRIRAEEESLVRREGVLSEGLRGKQLGIVGLGAIGREVARLGHAFDMTTTYTQRRRVSRADEVSLGVDYLSKSELLERADILSLHCPLTAETRNYLDRASFREMRSGAFLVNTARAGLVDESALLDSLDNGVLAGAGLDVYESEPLGSQRLRRHPRVVLVPHVGSSTYSTRAKMTQAVFRQIRQVFRGGIPCNVVNETQAMVGREDE